MLPFDDILNMIPPNAGPNAANAALNEDLTKFEVEIKRNQDALSQVNDFTDSYISSIQETDAELQEKKDSINASLASINSSLDAILGTQNEQLNVLRAQQPIQANAINSIITNSQTSSTSSVQNQLNQASNFVSNLEQIENFISSSVQSQSNQSSSASSSNRSSNFTNIGGNVSTTNPIPVQVIGTEPDNTGLSISNPIDREMIALFENFTTQNRTSNLNSRDSRSSSFLINNNALNSTLSDIESGEISVDNTEIENRVSQTSNRSSSSIENLTTAITNSISTALAQHDQKLVETISNRTSVNTRTETLTNNINNETKSVSNVQNQQNGSDEAARDKFVLETNLAMISNHLMNITSLLSSMKHKQFGKW